MYTSIFGLNEIPLTNTWVYFGLNEILFTNSWVNFGPNEIPFPAYFQNCYCIEQNQNISIRNANFTLWYMYTSIFGLNEIPLTNTWVYFGLNEIPFTAYFQNCYCIEQNQNMRTEAKWMAKILTRYFTFTQKECFYCWSKWNEILHDALMSSPNMSEQFNELNTY